MNDELNSAENCPGRLQGVLVTWFNDNKEVISSTDPSEMYCFRFQINVQCENYIPEATKSTKVSMVRKVLFQIDIQFENVYQKGNNSTKVSNVGTKGIVYQYAI